MWRGVDGSVIGRATTTMSLFGEAVRAVKPPRAVAHVMEPQRRSSLLEDGGEDATGEVV